MRKAKRMKELKILSRNPPTGDAKKATVNIKPAAPLRISPSKKDMGDIIDAEIEDDLPFQ